MWTTQDDLKPDRLALASAAANSIPYFPRGEKLLERKKLHPKLTNNLGATL